MGVRPHRLAVVHELERTHYHAALDVHGVLGTPYYLSSGNKFAGKDPWKRRKWRSRLALDMWQVLHKARAMFPDAVLLYLENDAVLKPGRIRTAVDIAKDNAVACYRAHRETWYSGSGTLCFVLPPSVDPSGHLLAYHLVQPADWIMSDFARGRWPALDCVSHGVGGKPHVSTLDI